MGRWAKLLGMVGEVRDPDVSELAPEGNETLVHEVPVDDIHTNPFQPRRWFRAEPLAELASSVRADRRVAGASRGAVDGAGDTTTARTGRSNMKAAPRPQEAGA